MISTFHTNVPTALRCAQFANAHAMHTILFMRSVSVSEVPLGTLV